MGREENLTIARTRKKSRPNSILAQLIAGTLAIDVGFDDYDDYGDVNSPNGDGRVNVTALMGKT